MSLAPIRIQIGNAHSKPYKSIDCIDWDGVPGLSVLTGLNGSGKTQLLEALAYRLTDTILPGHPDSRQLPIVITGDTFTPDSVSYIPSNWQLNGSPAIGVAEMQSAKQQFYQQFFQGNNQYDMRTQRVRARMRAFFGENALHGIGHSDLSNLLPDDFTFMLDEVDLTQGLVHVFFAHRVRIIELIEGGTPRDDIQGILGPAPWDVLNETFQAADFPYRAVSPVGTKLLEQYQLFLENPNTGQRIRPEDLSSGEKVLLGLVLWLYNSRHHNRFPRLFLLDEPDAHLHPSMTRHLLNVIREVLVERYGVRTILTTHSPSTVAMAPDGSVFEMSKTAPRIRPSGSRAASIGLLTAGLVTVSASTRYTLVEDVADVAFYDAVRDVLTDYGPTKDPQAIAPAPSIVFLPASVGKGTGKVGGGKTIVESWVNKFDQPPLNELIRGVIDRDISNIGTNRVYPIGRYSVENYLLDPFVVFGALLDIGAAPPIPSVIISTGDEHRLRSMSAPMLQSILTVMQEFVEPILISKGKTDIAPYRVSFTNGISIDYPAWAINVRGHDLLQIYQSVFGGSGILTPPRLERSFRRIRLIPVELAQIMLKLQT